MSRPVGIYIDPEVARWLKIYASAKGVSINKLGSQVLGEWLDKQPAIGDRKSTNEELLTCSAS